MERDVFPDSSCFTSIDNLVVERHVFPETSCFTLIGNFVLVVEISRSKNRSWEADGGRGGGFGCSQRERVFTVSPYIHSGGVKTKKNKKQGSSQEVYLPRGLHPRRWKAVS